MRVHVGNALETLYAGQFTLSVDKTKLSCNIPHRRSTTVTKLPSLNI